MEGGVWGWGLAFPLIEANSPLYSMKMPQSHLPLMPRSVVEILSSYGLGYQLYLGVLWVIGGESKHFCYYSVAILTQKSTLVEF